MFIKMPQKSKEKIKETRREIEIPQDVEISVENNELVARKEGIELKRKFFRVFLEREENRIVIKTKGTTRKGKKIINTTLAHIKNMFLGLKEKFVYKLQICSVHFPMNVSVKNDEIIVKNFLGEGKERKAKILPSVDVKIEKDMIIVESHGKEAAGQTAANIEKTTKVRNKDRRVFQDGIFITEKCGRKI